MNKRSPFHDLIFALFFAIFAVSSGLAESLVPLTGHVAKQIQSALKLERAPADELVQLSLVVNLDQTLMNDTLDQIYGPGSPANKPFLSSSEFAQRFDIATKRALLKNFAAANGLTVDTAEDQPESLVVKVSGPASVVEQAFGVQLNHYRAANGQIFRAHDTEPMIPASLAPHLGAVLGLSNFVGAAHPHWRLATPYAASRQAVLAGMTGPSGLSPTDIKTIYGLNGVALSGSGQTVALFELDGYAPSDITQYRTAFSIPNIPITFVGVDGATNTRGAGAVEVTLDIELVMALAPGLSGILDYGGLNTEQGRNDTYAKIAADNTAKEVSTSWGLDEQETDPSEMTAENTIFQQMAAQGQTMYAAAGDCGAYDQANVNTGKCITTNGFRVDNPASQPYVTGVGGTSLSGSVATPTEAVWNEFGIDNGGSGGGVSSEWPLPSYQVGVAGTASQTSRNVPDVTLNADPDTSPYAIYSGGSWGSIGGTSAAAPLWASLTALINQERAAASKGNLGFANAVFYQLGTSTSSASIFNDITSGNNGTGSSGYKAGSGYDNASGWGSFKGTGIINSVGSAIILTAQSTALINVYAFPNPWDTRKESRRAVTIANLPDGATVKIFTLSGFYVKTLPPSSGGSAVWDLNNDTGSRAASGLYFYYVTTPTDRFRGEIAIIK